MTFELAGIGAAAGIAIGTAVVLEPASMEIPDYSVARDELESEEQRLRAALALARDELLRVREAIPKDAPQDTRLFIDAHLLMLDDPALRDRPIALIREQHRNAAWALHHERERLVEVFERMQDPYLRAKREDILQVTDRVLRHLLGAQVPSLKTAAERIIVASELSPADTVLLKNGSVLGWVTDFGAATSHSAILARSLGLPAVVGTHHATRLLRSGDQLVVDGEQGTVLVNPGPELLAEYREMQARRERRRQLLEEERHLPALTIDGTAIRLFANIELPEDIEWVQRSNAEGIGLFRSEFLFMNRADSPSEEEQYAAFAQVLRALPGAEITIRSVDVGADKLLADSDLQLYPSGLNPALGLRGLRLCLRRPEWFRRHLRAILRASALAPIRLMLPMVSTVYEVQQTRQLIEQLRSELRAEGQKVAEHLPIGIMVEVPAVAMAAHAFAGVADFFSIGTNDLTQYALAVDRSDDDVNALFDPLHVGVLSMIQHTIAAGDAAGIPVAMCGEMASNPQWTALLVGLGLRHFSMFPGAIPEVKAAIRATSVEDAKVMALAALAGTSELFAHVDDIET
ncbi:phosphoenolpyruvate--protein phosphotransferase [Acidithiobacillus sp. CV18-2]|uniref:Phosphoenolpyruvate-protein phosphotransferase n=1 Tax=Igneacidithiobacillus copahuensis TaxID=2724909 RepID=A0AAE3CII8_9PROT|nr:phosphoenolpyruvate--protein phosphotransferase [Acidithiobacillus sp. CV18-3]MBU2758286.1 phosphoenolpyruvate--protein phosphotransferase [Acidithiobacillus sp. BN09-2]MBU2778061.1 phosphoenolpyruvate--protein phosphotransferase [Acidithiobacillus sp. CV18-2]MBU2786694.1 phosphoenolpyruvate--protein phosphotransferase [Igneacidithiobacillus copahuensis]MBU2796049.1 phosphoenolpyruvate--protein phosphotransferase [Acidithiobacillus sp. VAN18-2]MBU2798028.1 phosphoenolpyruvate--protein phosp